MDEKFNKAIEQSNYRVIFENQKEKLKEIFEGQLILPFNGGFFQIKPELFSEILIYLNEEKKEQILLDMHQNPILIDNLPEFYEIIRSKYSEALNEYVIELAKLKLSRQIPTVVELDLKNDEEE